MTIIDLGTVRATRAAELQAAKELTDTAVATVKAAAEGYAEMAFGLSRMVRLHSEQLAVDVNRSQWRRVLATVKAATRQATPEIREAFRDIASQAFTERLDHLIREDDKRRGVTEALEVVGGMWVTAGRTRWKPNPWPCTVTLGRPGALAWMDPHRAHALRHEARDPEAVRRGPGGAAGPGSVAERGGGEDRQPHHPGVLGARMASWRRQRERPGQP